MPSNDLPKRPCLLLRVYSEPWEVECKQIYCDIGGYVDCVNGTLRYRNNNDVYNVSWAKKGKCPACRGTGKRRVRLVGLVEVEMDELEELGSASSYSLEIINTNISTGWFSFREQKEMQQCLSEKATAAWRDGSPPEAVREGLREVDVDDKD